MREKNGVSGFYMSLLHLISNVKSRTKRLHISGTSVAFPWMVASLQEGRNNWVSVQIFIGQLFDKNFFILLWCFCLTVKAVLKNTHTLHTQQFEHLGFNKNKSQYFSCQRIQNWINPLLYLTSMSTRTCMQEESPQGRNTQERCEFTLIQEAWQFITYISPSESPLHT